VELVYLWVKNYKNIHEQGFNFSSRFNCDYNEKKNKLTIEENDDYIPDFFGKNINVTAIVGKNGSGKSGILGALNKILNSKFDSKYILVSNIEEKTHVLSNTIDSDWELNNYKQKIHYYQFSNEIINGENQISLGDKEITKMIVHDYSKSRKFNLSTFMYLPETIEIFPINLDDRIEDFVSEQELQDSSVGKLEIPKQLEKESDERYELVKGIDDFHKFLILWYLKEHAKYTQEEHSVLENKDELLEYFNDDLEDNVFTHDDFKRYFVKGKKNIKDLSEKEKILYFFGEFNSFFTFDFIDSKQRRFSNLSHGEKVFFGQLLTIYYYLDINYKGKFIFLFDEPEVALHPDWQKKYMSEILNLLRKSDKESYFIFTSHSPFLLSDIPKQNIIFLDKEENGNCKVLNHDEVLEKKETFGANIHTLLSDGFFMEDGLMGEFAKSKINKIKKFYQFTQNKNIQKKLENQKIKELAQKAFNRRKERLWQIQKIIGEPFLQRVIKNYLDELELLFSDDKTLIAKELAEIEERKKHLEALQKRNV